MSATSSPLPASSLKFLALSLPHSLFSCTEKLTVFPNNTHVPFTLPAHYGKLFLLWPRMRSLPCPADHAGFPSSLFRSHSLHTPGGGAGWVPAPQSSSYRLPSILTPAPFLAPRTRKRHPPAPLQHPRAPFPLYPATPFAPPPPLPLSPLTAPPFAVRTTCP